jgi:hypothetical protein
MSALTPVLHRFQGRCHCGALGFSFETALPVMQWSVRACQCGFCRARGALTTSDPSGRLRFEVNEAGALQRYRFGLKTADFLLCRHCGVYIGAQIETADGAFGIINTLALTPFPDELPGATAANYDAEGTPERIERRQKRWTPLEQPV